MLVADEPDRADAFAGRELATTESITELDLGDVLVLPGLVNAHTHLDLADLPRAAFEGDFVDWAKGVASGRRRSDRSPVHAALKASREAGVFAVGDIAGFESAIEARLEDGLPGISWLEVFGIDPADTSAPDRALQRLDDLRSRAVAADFAIELQPHAPYSVGPALYRLASTTGRPSTHLCETEDELEFVRSATGRFRDLLREIGKWNPAIEGAGSTPIEALRHELERAPWVLAHVNYATDDDLAVLARSKASVAYCPLASEYFGHRDHRYREMLARGINVCLGTDSIVCQPIDEAQPHGILPQMRRLYRRDGTDPGTLLRMATRNGAQALGLTDGTGSLDRGAPARFCVVPISSGPDPLQVALGSEAPARGLDLTAAT